MAPPMVQSWVQPQPVSSQRVMLRELRELRVLRVLLGREVRQRARRCEVDLHRALPLLPLLLLLRLLPLLPR